MRTTALTLALLLLTAGCLGGGSDEATETQSLDEIQGQATGNGTEDSSNATYLKNQDYNETHVHDYWGEAESRLLMDETFSTNTMQSVFLTAFWPVIAGEPRTSMGTIWFSLPNNTFVPEGTGELLVEVDATAALEGGGLELAYRAANTDEFVTMDPQGAQATWAIQLTPEMADLPHASSTRWYWRLDASGNGAVLDGEVSVKVTAEKLYDLEAWPAHDDAWERGTIDRLDLLTTNGTFDKTAEQQWMSENGQPEEPIRLPEGSIVPPETELVLLKLWYGLDGDAKNNANVDIGLRLKEGSTSSWYRTLWSEQIEDRPGFKMYAVEAGSSNWDSPYADESGWAFAIYAATGVRNPVGDGGFIYMSSPETGSGNYTLEVDAYREIPAWVQGAMEDA